MSIETAIIGGGIAGLSLASELAERRGTGAGITVLEAEESLAFHTSSRSAQQLIPSYGPEPVLELTRLTIPALLSPAHPSEAPLAWSSPFLVVGNAADVAAETVEGLRTVSGAELFALCPELAGNPQRYQTGAIDDSAVRTDATALVAWHRARAVRAGVRIGTGSRVGSGEFAGGRWNLRINGNETVTARTVVDAAGAWADHVADSCGAVTQRLGPLRRTAALVSLADPLEPTHPMVCDAADEWYYRPDPAGAMISWGEAEPSPACDAQPHPGAVDRLVATLERETALRVTGVSRAWTGLRTETPADVPVCGWDTRAPNFLWLAGQGGYGFQTSAALARAATDLLTAGAVGDWLSEETTAALLPRQDHGAGNG